jgi:hypothetical protein
MKTYEGVEVQLQPFITSAPQGGKWSASRLGRFTSGGTAHGINFMRGCVGSNVSLDATEKKKSLVSASNP